MSYTRHVKLNLPKSSRIIKRFNLIKYFEIISLNIFQVAGEKINFRRKYFLNKNTIVNVRKVHIGLVITHILIRFRLT